MLTQKRSKKTCSSGVFGSVCRIWTRLRCVWPVTGWMWTWESLMFGCCSPCRSCLEVGLCSRNCSRTQIPVFTWGHNQQTDSAAESLSMSQTFWYKYRHCVSGWSFLLTELLKAQLHESVYLQKCWDGLCRIENCVSSLNNNNKKNSAAKKRFIV